MEPFPGENIKRRAGGRGSKVSLTAEQEEWLCRWYPTIENSRLMDASGLSHSTLHRLAREKGLTKSEEGMRGIKRRQTTALMRTCRKNGYYKSLKGKAPSEACVDGYRKYLKSERYKHPMIIMKEKNPRKYKATVKRRREERKELIRKEKLRLLYGMPKKTNLPDSLFVMAPYTRSQTSHRYNALKRGYFLSEDKSEKGGERYIIFYDDNTRRSALFEKNCIADGFTFRYEPA